MNKTLLKDIFYSLQNLMETGYEDAEITFYKHVPEFNKAVDYYVNTISYDDVDKTYVRLGNI